LSVLLSNYDEIPTKVSSLFWIRDDSVLSVGCKYEYTYSRSSYYSNATSTKE